MRRLAVVTTSYPRAPGDPSGHFVRSRATAAARRGDDVVVFAPGPPGVFVEDSLVRVGVGGRELFGWPGAWPRFRERPLRLLDGAWMARRLRRELARRGPFDAIEAHWIVPTAWPLCRGIEGVMRVFAHGADVRALLGMPAPVRRHIVMAVLARSSTWVFAAETLRDALAQSLPPDLARSLRARSRVEPPPIDLPRRDTLGDPRAEGVPGPSGAYAVWAGRCIAEKRPHLAVEAAARAELPLVVLGDGPDQPAHGGNVYVLGRVPRDEALRWIAGARALLSTSLTEAAPTAVREARALDVPVVATPAGDLALWARSDAGIHLANDAEGLARALTALGRESEITGRREDGKTEGAVVGKE